MSDADDIPLLTDMIEDESVDITQPDFAMDVDRDLVIGNDDDPVINLANFDDDRIDPLFKPPQPEPTPIESELEKTVKRILDEHMELAWQEIRLAIHLAESERKSDR